jgi:hypothetical protein
MFVRKNEPVRLYVKVVYRFRKFPLGYSAYDLAPARKRLMKMSDLPKFQMDLRMGGHQIISISRLSEDEYKAEKEKMMKRRQQRAKAN